MFKNKLFISLLIASLCMLTFTGIVMAEDTETVTADEPLPQPRKIEGTPKIGIMFTVMAAESTQRIKHHAHISFEKRGWDYVEITDCNNASSQRNAMETFINKDVDAIFLVFPTMQKLTDLCIEAREKGIGVYCVDTELRPGVIVNATQSNGIAGSRCTYYGVNRLEYEGDVLIIANTAHFGVRQRAYAARGLLANEWPQLKVVGMEMLPMPGWEKATQDITSNYITRFGNELDWVFAGWDTPGIIAAREIEANGFTNDDIFCTGIDGGSEAWGEIRKDSPFVATVSQPFEQYANTCYKIFKEIQIEGVPIGSEDSSLPNSRTIYHESILTTKENIPPKGSVVHKFFDYYDPDAPQDIWYNWGDQYMVTK